MNIRVIDGFEKSTTRDFAFSTTNARQSYAQQNKEPRDGGFSRVDRTGEAGSPPLQGFDRTPTELMNGYQGADETDMQDWDFLVTMEHPEVMQGIQGMQGKAERQARKQQRQEKKQQKAQQKQSGGKGATVRPGKAKRLQKRAERQQKRTDKKDLRLAKKEQKVLAKAARRERKDAQSAARIARKAGRGERIKEIFSDLGEKAKDVVSTLANRPDVLDMTASEMSLPGGAGEFLDRWRDMPIEDVLDERDELTEDMMYNRSAEDLANAAKPAADDSGDSKGGSGMLILGAAVLGVAAMSGKKGKKKGKK